jgi:hypothetical protein
MLTPFDSGQHSLPGVNVLEPGPVRAAEERLVWVTETRKTKPGRSSRRAGQHRRPSFGLQKLGLVG